MDYPAITEREFADARSLNRAFLDCVSTAAPPRAVPGTLKDALSALNPSQRERLSGAPFLLFDLDYPMLGRRLGLSGRSGHSGDLLAENRLMPAHEWRVVSATLGFLWYLSRENRYAARLLGGVPPDWCDRVAEARLLEVLDEAAGFDSLLTPRCRNVEPFWQGLLRASRHRRPAEFRVGCCVALHRLLTNGNADGHVQLAVAACQHGGKHRRTTDR